MNITIRQAIDRADELYPNGYSEEQKRKWLSTLDHNIYENVIKTHEGADDVEFSGYDVNTDGATELLVPAPFDDVYIYWLGWHYDLFNTDINNYNNKVALYDNVYDKYEAWYNRTHMPKQIARERYF